MNIYDFDGTIYNGDSGIDFIKYSFIRAPFLVTISLIKCFFKFLKYKRGKVKFEEVKSAIFSYVKRINNLERFISKFVNKNKYKIKRFYLTQKKKNDVIITASLDFYVKPLCHSVGIKRIISTKYDVNKCQIIGDNCKGDIKAQMIEKRFPNTKIKDIYTDSLSDSSMFKYAQNVYIVNKDKIKEYDENYKFKKKLFNLDFIIFVFCGAISTLSNFVVSSLISTRINPIISYVIGYSISLFVAYLLNITYIFSKKIRFFGFLKFVISYLPNFIILFSFVYVFIDILSFNKYITYLAAAIIGIPLTFVILKLITFKKKA